MNTFIYTNKFGDLIKETEYVDQLGNPVTETRVVEYGFKAPSVPSRREFVYGGEVLTEGDYRFACGY
jgi:hypothetical protein